MEQFEESHLTLVGQRLLGGEAIDGRLDDLDVCRPGRRQELCVVVTEAGFQSARSAICSWCSSFHGSFGRCRRRSRRASSSAAA